MAAKDAAFRSSWIYRSSTTPARTRRTRDSRRGFRGPTDSLKPRTYHIPRGRLYTPDDREVAECKRRKLRIKDEIERLKSSVH
jgi:hypothetical protein